MHESIPPTTDERGDETHPAFGAISAHRISSSPGAVLFDSEIKHTHLVRLRIGRMTRKRDLNHDRMYPDNQPLIEVDMSEAQWASFVSSMNTSAVPCTLRQTENERNVPGLDFAPRLALSTQETKDAARRALAQVKDAFDALDALDGKAGVKARRDAMHRLRSALQNAPANVEFASTSLSEHAENVTQKARADIEAMVVTHARQLGIDSTEIIREITG